MTARFPSYGVVEMAIAMQINPAQIHLSQNLLQSQPQLDITKVKIRQSEITVVENLPTYHLRGSYQVNLQLPRHKFKQNQLFDLYIQQQKQNKSWRLLIPESVNKNTKNIILNWQSYLININ
jgi:uncharacterized protein YjbK